jgi:hypothetical protein
MGPTNGAPMTEPQAARSNIWVDAMNEILMSSTMSLHLAVSLASPEAAEAWWHQANVVTIRLLSSYLARGPKAAVRAVQFLLEADCGPEAGTALRLLDERLKHPEDKDLSSRTIECGMSLAWLGCAHTRRFMSVNDMLNAVADGPPWGRSLIELVFKTLRDGGTPNDLKDSPADERLIVPLRALGPPSVEEVLTAFGTRPE